MAELNLEKLNNIISFARLLEQCQTLKLISPDDRGIVNDELNEKAHEEIKKILTPTE